MHHLVFQARSGNKKAFEKLVELSQNRVFAVAYGITGIRQDAEDIAQDVFVKAYKGIGGLKNETTFYHWLIRIAVNTSINYKKSSRETWTVPLESISEPIDQGETPEAYVERTEHSRNIARVLNQLTPEFRAVLVLREIEGFAYREIAETLEIPLGTIKSRINHAREKLRRAIEDDGVR